MPMTDAEKLRRKVLARWEGEGGGLGSGEPRADALDESEVRILARIGYAALREWDELPEAARQAMLDNVCRPLRPGDGSLARERIAEFMRLYGER
jgi:hypothetical protein